MQDFHQLDVWKRAHELALAVYRNSRDLPREEGFGVMMQMRRAALNIPTRIAEGSGRGSNIEFGNDLRRAAAHCSELEYLVLVVKDLGYWKEPVAESLTGEVTEVRKMLSGLLRNV